MNLLLDKERVIPTPLTRKITLDGVTKVYPVYKIRIDALYYNDQNDRIATWISQYKNENKDSLLENLGREQYNDLIEQYVVLSNPTSIVKTQTNIELVGQREPGVVLSDGRIIDGNRRYTCIRRLSRKIPENCWFESVILDVDLNNNKKTIKMLELAIQHGEEKRVDYNQLEKYIGIYQDIVDTKLLTIDEYAFSTNENIVEIKKRVEASKIIIEFLEYIKLPKQYHIVREISIVSLVNDVLELCRKYDENEIVNIKRVVFLNTLMSSYGEERKFIKDLATILKNNMFELYLNKQLEIEKKVFERFNQELPQTYAQIKTFAKLNFDLSSELVDSLEYSLHGAKRTELYNEPTKIASKVISSLRSIDTNIVSKLPKREVQIIKNQIDSINNIVSSLKNVVNDEISTSVTVVQNNNELDFVKSSVSKKIEIIPSRYNDFIEIDNQNKNQIFNLLFKISVKQMFDNINNDYKFYFVNEKYEISSNVIETKVAKDYQTLTFKLDSKISNEKKCYLVIKKSNDEENEARFLIEFDLNISFGSGFEF